MNDISPADGLIFSPSPSAEVQNRTGLPGRYFQAGDTTGQAFHVVVLRATYDMTQLDADGTPRLLASQPPLIEKDQFYGSAENSSPLQESDFAPFKPKCDVLFCHAVAYAPDGQALPRWRVGVKLGEWSKIIGVAGPRYMDRTLAGWKVTSPRPVPEVAIRYERAWGGTCQWPLTLFNEAKPEIFAQETHNPIGCGYADKKWLQRHPVSDLDAPQFEDIEYGAFDEQAANLQSYPVVGLGAIGRKWQPRMTLVDSWEYDPAVPIKTLQKVLPANFDFAYWNCAPVDQQIDYPEGGEEIILAGLNRDGPKRLRLPTYPIEALLHLKVGPVLKCPFVVDTIIFDMDAQTLACVHRLTASAAEEIRNIKVQFKKI